MSAPETARGDGVDEEMAQAWAATAAELAALRARLRAVEVALDLPARPGRPAPPTVPMLARRVADLERHVGLIPGLVPLPGYRPAAPTPPTRAEAPPPAARSVGAGWGQAVVAAALLVALLAWLTLPARPRSASPPAAPPAVTATVDAAPVPAAPPTRGTSAPEPPTPAGAVDCPLATAGSCLGQWTSPPTGDESPTYPEDRR